MTKITGRDAQWLDESAFPPLITAAEQLAVDEAILDEAESGLLKNPVVRTWQAAAPVVVLGSSSELLKEVNLMLVLDSTSPFYDAQVVAQRLSLGRVVSCGRS